MIHPTAVVHPGAQLGAGTTVGPGAVIDEYVVLGADCRVGPHVHLTGRLTAGARNVFHAGCVIGDAPQDLKYRGDPTGVRIGDGNTFREHVTVNRSNRVDDETVIGSDNFLMANSHVGHNCRLGDGIILANGVLLAGHVTIEDRAFISGNAVVHQFTRVGRLALMQGIAGIGKDLPPFTIARGVNTLVGLNTIGLRRAGLDPAVRLELRRLYRILFRSGLLLPAALAEARPLAVSEPARYLITFIEGARRGVCTERSSARNEDDA